MHFLLTEREGLGACCPHWTGGNIHCLEHCGLNVLCIVHIITTMSIIIYYYLCCCSLYFQSLLERNKQLLSKTQAFESFVAECDEKVRSVKLTYAVFFPLPLIRINNICELMSLLYQSLCLAPRAGKMK